MVSVLLISCNLKMNRLTRFSQYTCFARWLRGWFIGSERGLPPTTFTVTITKTTYTVTNITWSPHLKKCRDGRLNTVGSHKMAVLSCGSDDDTMGLFRSVLTGLKILKSVTFCLLCLLVKVYVCVCADIVCSWMYEYELCIVYVWQTIGEYNPVY